MTSKKTLAAVSVMDAAAALQSLHAQRTGRGLSHREMQIFLYLVQREAIMYMHGLVFADVFEAGPYGPELHAVRGAYAQMPASLPSRTKLSDDIMELVRSVCERYAGYGHLMTWKLVAHVRGDFS